MPITGFTTDELGCEFKYEAFFMDNGTSILNGYGDFIIYQPSDSSPYIYIMSTTGDEFLGVSYDFNLTGCLTPINCYSITVGVTFRHWCYHS